MDTTKKCFVMIDGAAKLTMKAMSIPDMKELVEVLTKEIDTKCTTTKEKTTAGESFKT